MEREGDRNGGGEHGQQHNQNQGSLGHVVGSR
jgi:hypothetical protein